jgi:HEAT repeat protein
MLIHPMLSHLVYLLRLRVLPKLLVCTVWILGYTQAFSQAEPRLWDKTVSQWIEIAQSDNDAEQRLDAALALGCLGPKARQAASTLVALLEDTDDRVRAEAASSLGRIGEENGSVITALVKALDDVDSSVALAAAESLGTFGSSAIGAIDSLIGMLDRDSDRDVLLAALTDVDQETQELAIYALKAVGSSVEPAIPDLIAALDSKSWIVRSNAAELLGEIGPAAAGATAVLIKLLSDSALEVDEYFWGDVRYSAAEALGEIGAPAKSAIPRLQDLEEDDFITLRHSAAEALLKIRQANPPRE